MVKAESFFVKWIIGLGAWLCLAAALSAQTLNVTITGTLGPIITAGVAGGKYESGITATGSKGQTCLIQFTNGGGTGATATVLLSAANTIAQPSNLTEVAAGSGYTSSPTSAMVISGGTATCSGSSVVVQGSVDSLGLNGAQFTATTSLNPVGVAYNPTSISYPGLSLTVSSPAFPFALTCTGAVSTVSTPAGSNDSLHLSNCNFPKLAASFDSVTAFAPGSFPSPIPLAFNAGILTSPDTLSEGTYTVLGFVPTTLGISGTASATCSGCPTETLTPAGPLSFTATAGGGAPTAQSVTVGTGGVNLAYAVTASQPWITVNSAATTGGTTASSGSFQVDVNPASLTPGQYSGTVNVYTAASNSPQSVTVNLTVNPTPFTLTPSPSSFTFNSVNGAQPASQNLGASTSPSMSVSYTATPSSTGNWLSVSPTTGTTGGTALSVSVNPALSAGTYSGSIALSATGATNSPTAGVTFNVTSIPAPGALTFNAQTGGSNPNPQTLNVTATGPNVTYSASASSSGWLSVSSGTFTTNGAGPTVSVNINGLSANTYTGTVNINPAFGNAIPVTVTLNLTSLPSLVSGSPSLSFTSNAGSQPPSQPLSITSSAAAITYAAATSPTGSWLQISSSGGTTPGSETVSINLAGLATGVYNGSVIFTCSPTSSCANASGQLTVPVTLTVTADLTPAPTSLTFNYAIGGTLPGAQGVGVTSDGGAITYTATATSNGGSWLAVTPSSATTPTGISASLNAGVVTGLGAGQYTGNIALASAGANHSPVNVPVTLNVITLSVTGGPLSFTMVDLGSLPSAQNLTVTASNGGAVPFTATVATQAGSGNWLSATSGTTPGSSSVSILANSLAPGTYTGTVTITPTGGSTGVAVGVTLVVSPPPNISGNPGSLSYNYTLLSGTNPSSQTVSVAATGGAVIPFTAAATISGNQSPFWLSVTSNSANTPATLTVSVNPAGLAAGTYTGSISLTSSQAANSPQSIGVTFIVNPAPNLGTSTPTLTFAYQTGGSTPASQPITISSNGAALNFTATPSTTSGGAWLAVSPTSGTTGGASGTLSISIVPAVLTTLGANTYTGNISIASQQAGNTPVTIGVTLTVSSLPSLTATPSALSFSYTLNGSVPGSQPVTIGSTGSALTSVSATTSTPWLQVQQNGTSTPFGLTVSLIQASIPTTAGSYTGSISIAATGAGNTPLNFPVTLIVSAQPSLSVAPTAMTFNAQVNGGNPGSQALNVSSSNGSVSFTAAASSTGNWLSVSPTSGSTNTTIHVSVNTAGLLASNSPFSGSIVVTASGATGSPITIPVTLNLSPDNLTATPSPLSFIFQAGGTAPAAQNLNVASTIAGLSFTAVPNASWLKLSAGSGTTPQTLSVSINTAGLTVGQLSSSITITASGAGNSPVSVPVNLAVTSAPPLTATPTSLTYSYTLGGSTPASQTVQIAAGANAVAFTTSVTTSGGNWLAVSPASGTTPQSITVSLMNLSGLAPNTYHGTVTATGPGGNIVSIPVTLTVSAVPLIMANPTSLSFSYTSGGTVPTGQSIAVSTSNSASAAFAVTPSTTSGGRWLQVSPANGASPASFVVSVVPNSLAAGNYSGTVTISAPGFTSTTVSVSLTVIQPKAVIQINGGSQFVLPNTAPPATATITVAASDGSAQPFTIALGVTPNNWLKLSATSGTTPANIVLTATPAGLIPGIYIIPITVTEPALPIPTKTFNAQLTITGSNLAASPTMLAFSYQPGAPIPPSQSIALTVASGSGTVPLASVTTDVQWLSVTNATSAPATVQVSLNPGLLTPGTYTAAVLVKGLGSPSASLQVPVTVTIGTQSPLTAVPTSLAFTYQIGGSLPAPQSFALSTGTAPLNFIATSPGSWLLLSPTHGTTPGSVLVSAEPAGLAVGSYSGSIKVSAIGASNVVLIPVTLTVTGAPQLTFTPGQLSFTAASAATAPPAQTVAVSSAGGPLTFTAAPGSIWLAVTPTSGTTPATISVSVNPAGLQNGTYMGTINITPAGTAVAQMLLVTLQVGPASATPTIQGVINAASGAVGKVSPGMAISIFGSSLGPQTGVGFTNPAEGGTVATTLGGTQVMFDGIAAPMLFSWNGQVNALVPFAVSGKTSTVMTVSYGSTTSAPMTLPVVVAEPGLFTANSSGSGQGSILNQDSSVNTANNPAAPGTIIQLFGTGGGLTVPPSTDGALNPLTSTGLLALPVTATVGGQTVQVQYYGPAPGLVSGIIQINVTIPSGTAAGNIPVVIQVGSFTSQTTVTVAVQ